MTSPWWSAWNLDLPSLAFLGGAAALYLRGAARRRASGHARPRATVAFLAGCAVLLVAFVTPIAGLSDALLWVHMVQHLLLTVVAAPLLALGGSVATVRLGLPGGARRAVSGTIRRSSQVSRRIGAPPTLVLATAAHVAALWVWHAPPLYDAAATSAAVHLLEHATFLGTAVWLWTAVMATATRDARRMALATVCLGALIAQGGVLGALLSFAGRSVYTTYEGVGGLSALEDQQLAGALMWVPPGFVYATVAVRRFVGWLDTAERELVRREGSVHAPDASTPTSAQADRS